MMAFEESKSYTANQDVRDAIATLVDNLPEGNGRLGYYKTRIGETEESCLIVIALHPRDIAKMIERLGLSE